MATFPTLHPPCWEHRGIILRFSQREPGGAPGGKTREGVGDPLQLPPLQFLTLARLHAEPAATHRAGLPCSCGHRLQPRPLLPAPGSSLYPPVKLSSFQGSSVPCDLRD